MPVVLRLTVLAAGLALVAGNLAAQQTPTSRPDMRPNSFYTEIGGNIGDFSVNYDRLIGNAVVARVGIGTSSESYGDCFGIGFISQCEGTVDVSLIGVTLGRLFGRTHMAELGLGGAFGVLTDETSDPFVGGSSSIRETVSTLTATIGYRWQGRGRWLVRAGYTPSYVVQGDTQNYPKDGLTSAIGVSVGFGF